MTTNLPVKKFRSGAISATVWSNKIDKDGMTSEYKTISFDRRYKTKDTDEWKSTKSLRVSDIPKALLVLSKAYEYTSLSDEDGEVIEEVI